MFQLQPIKLQQKLSCRRLWNLSHQYRCWHAT